MGSTNLTPNYELSQFIGTDKPAWLQDYNGDMLKIDTGIAGAKTAADNAQSAADGAQGDATTALSDIANINTELGTVENTLSTATGNINTINSLIGNGTPTTTDQTIIGAINEINAHVGQIEDDEEWTDITDQCTFAVTPIRAFVKMRKNEISFRVNMFMGGISSGDTIITLPKRLTEGFDGVYTLVDGNTIPTSSAVAVAGQDGATTIKAFFSGALTDYLMLSVTTAIKD